MALSTKCTHHRHFACAIVTLTLLQSSWHVETAADNSRVNSSMYLNNSKDHHEHCPSLQSITLHWHSFHPFTHYNHTTEKLEGDLPRYMEKSLAVCCSDVQLLLHRANISNSCEMEISIRQNINETPTAHFPIFSNRGEMEQFQRRFVGLFDSPGPALLKLTTENASLARFLYLLKGLWKLILICLLHAVLAGIVQWALEHKTNAQFPSGFVRGLGAGMWWAFVTMTTVGYGDKTPKSTLARTFAVLWMLEGTILFALFSATLTASITANEITTELNIIGKKVGVPMGMETFLMNEFNLGAVYKEYEDFHVLHEGEQHKDAIEYFLFFDYVIARRLLEDANEKSLVIERNIAHKFSVGMILTGDFGEDYEDFLSCWRREIVDNREIERAKQRSERKHKQEAEETVQPLDLNTWALILSAVLVLLVLVTAFITEYRRLKVENRIVPMNAQ